ncbi:18249_t:CDS:2 [Gigaspora margarita]|uniref:18249_t:CDS:1 n=1 Tax=Gigaspora margarita TaxID=4874 RepID=A0ABN7VFZ4_GIGMA|nr:18249_t:CDS:2 [Gigaspora margarita]
MNCQVKAIRSDIELLFDFIEQSDDMIIFNINYNSLIFNIHSIKLIATSKDLPNYLALYMRELGLSITYKQLDKKSNQIAQYLTQIGVKIETLVVIHLNQDMYIIPWILGILKTGSIYVPIDKTYSAKRKNYIIKDSEVSYFITDEECNDWVKNFFGKIIQSNTVDVTKQSDYIIESIGHRKNICYVMYTSGSTVKPKEVLIEHKNVTSLLIDPRYDYCKYNDGWAMAITNGSTICFAKNPKFLAGNYLLDVIKCNKIEAMNVVPSILATISPNDCSPTLKYLEVGEEVLPNKLVNIWKNHLKKFFNSYGPTKTGVIATNYDILTKKNLVTMDNGKTDHAKVKNIMPKLLKKTIESEIPRPQPKIDLVNLFQNLTIESLANLLMLTDQSLNLDNSNSIKASNNNQAINASEIAIISMVGCFPRAKSVNKLWNMIKTRQHGIHIFTNKELDEINAKNHNDPHYVPKCGVLSNIDKFDAKFFKISYQEATSMDPQQCLLLEKSVQALNKAGINPQYEKGQIGVFVAIEKSTYKNYSYNNENNLAKKYSEELNTSSESAATRIAFHLNLKGPAFSLNSTCSSSLTVLKTAWNSIQYVGAASFILPQSGYLAQPGLIFSANGIYRLFVIIILMELLLEILFIEAYRTATKLGDTVKIKALTQIFIELLPTTTKHCAISSVKSNIGYCNTAAGFTGLIKTVKALEDHVIPLMAKDHFEKANPLINFLYSPFYIASKLQNFNKTEVMYAGVSSFGIGKPTGIVF